MRSGYKSKATMEWYYPGRSPFYNGNSEKIYQGMNNKLKNLLESSVSLTLILIILGSLLTYQIIGKIFPHRYDIEVGISLALGLVIFAYLIWATVILVGNKQLKPTDPKKKLILLSLCCIFFIVYLCLTGNFVLALFPIWVLIRGIKEYKVSFE